MNTQEQFEDAQQRVKKLTQRPSNEELLDLYAYFKQATDGDNNEPQPNMFDLKEMFKWKMWKEKNGLSREDAMLKYTELVNTLLSKYTHD